MEELDKESIKYIVVKAWKPNLWKYSVNTLDEFSPIKQNDLIKMLNSLGIFNKYDFNECLSHHNDFIYKDNTITKLTMNRNMTDDEKREYVFGKNNENYIIKREMKPSLEQKWNNLFNELHEEFNF